MYSFLINVNGKDPKDINIYAVDVDKYGDINKNSKWFKVKLLQGIGFYASSNEILYCLNLQQISTELAYEPVSSPENFNGIVIFLGRGDKYLITTNMFFGIGDGKSVKQIVAIKSVEFSANTYENKLSICISKFIKKNINNNNFHTFIEKECDYDFPEWVNVTYENLLDE